MACRTIISHRSDSPAILRTLLHPLLCAMALPISASMKGVLWFVLFGMAKTFQYGGLTILGVEGVKRLKNWWQSKV